MTLSSGTKKRIASAIAAAPAAPYADDLVDITDVGRVGAECAKHGRIRVSRDTLAPVLAAPVRLVAEEDDGTITEVAILNNGAPIAPTTNLAWSELLFGIALYKKLVVVPAGVSGGGYNVDFIPVFETP